MRHFVALLLLISGCGSTDSRPDPRETEAAAAYLAAKKAYDAKDYDAAIERATDCVTMSPGHAPAYLIRAKALQKKGRPCENDFNMAVRCADEPNRSRYLFHRGRFHQDGGELEKALADFDQACELQKKYPIREYYFETFLERGRTNALMGHVSAALADYDFLLSIAEDENSIRQVERLKKELQGKRDK